MRGIGFILAMAMEIGFATGVSAFGTVSVAGQNREHERITRNALACGLPGGLGPAECFQPESINELAGKFGSFGAVGAPDFPGRGLITDPVAHCDNGDYLDPKYAGGRPYPQSLEDAGWALKRCKVRMMQNILAAAADSAALLSANGRIDDSQIPTYVSCKYTGHKGRAKCNVLEDFGLLLHATEDFYSHSNWVDRPDPGRPISRENPPGLGHDGPSPWLDMGPVPRGGEFPEGLISGCFVNLLAGSDQNGCPNRVPHEYLNKDKGQIDNAAGALAIGPGTTPRGMVSGNFQRAALAAILDTRAQWASLRATLNARYGPVRGARMICAITHDDPARTC